jgi:hypothetical protein
VAMTHRPRLPIREATCDWPRFTYLFIGILNIGKVRRELQGRECSQPPADAGYQGRSPRGQYSTDDATLAISVIPHDRMAGVGLGAIAGAQVKAFDESGTQATQASAEIIATTTAPDLRGSAFKNASI